MYKQLSRLLNEMASDRGMKQLPDEEYVWPANAPVMEEKLATLNLTEEAITTLAVGGEEEVQQMVNDLNLHDINEFLEQAFQGELHDNFFE